MAEADAPATDSAPTISARQLLALLALAAAVGLGVSLASWCFLQLMHYLPEWVYEDLPDAVGYEHGAPLLWYLPACAFAGLGVAFAIVRLPGHGKGLAWTISLASFRGGPVFPPLFLGAAAGLMGSHLAGFDQTAAVAVGMGAATVSVLGLPLSAVVLALLLTAQSGAGATPLIIVGGVAAYLTTRVLSRPARKPSPTATAPAHA